MGKEIIISKCFIYLLRSVQSDGQTTSLTIVWPRKHQHSKAAPAGGATGAGKWNIPEDKTCRIWAQNETK